MVYTHIAIAHRHFPVSFFMATNVAMQGKYKSMNIMKATAAGRLIEPASADWSWVLSSVAVPSEAYMTPRVLTTSSLATTPDSRLMSIFQLNPSGSIAGETALPNWPM